MWNRNLKFLDSSNRHNSLAGPVEKPAIILQESLMDGKRESVTEFSPLLKAKQIASPPPVHCAVLSTLI